MKTKSPKNTKTMIIELPQPMAKALKRESLRQSEEQDRFVSMTEIVRDSLTHSLSLDIDGGGVESMR